MVACTGMLNSTTMVGHPDNQLLLRPAGSDSASESKMPPRGPLEVITVTVWRSSRSGETLQAPHRRGTLSQRQNSTTATIARPAMT